MSEIVGIALLLLVPIFIVIAILNIANVKRRKKAQNRIHEYITEATKKTGITIHYQKQLIHQTIIIDEKSRKLLIIDHKGIAFSYDLCPLDTVKRIEVIHQKQEHITTKIGVELSLGKTGEEKFLTLYDYVEHNIYQLADFEREARQLQDKIIKAINSNQL